MIFKEREVGGGGKHKSPARVRTNAGLSTTRGPATAPPPAGQGAVPCRCCVPQANAPWQSQEAESRKLLRVLQRVLREGAGGADRVAAEGLAASVARVMARLQPGARPAEPREGAEVGEQARPAPSAW